MWCFPTSMEFDEKRYPPDTRPMHGLYMAIFCWFQSPNFFDRRYHSSWWICHMCHMLVCHLSFHGLVDFSAPVFWHGFTRSDLVSLTFPLRKNEFPELMKISTKNRCLKHITGRVMGGLLKNMFFSFFTDSTMGKSLYNFVQPLIWET